LGKSEKVIHFFPLQAYSRKGTALLNLARLDEASATYRLGLEVSEVAGHALHERKLQEVLQMQGPGMQILVITTTTDRNNKFESNSKQQAGIQPLQGKYSFLYDNEELSFA
jgi:hypothetical protein